MTRKILLLRGVSLGSSDLPAGATPSFADEVADDLIRRGFAAELTVAGTGTITNGSASVSVPHGLGRLPTEVRVTGQHQEVSQPWVSPASPTAFTVNVASNTTADRNFYWCVQ